MSRCAYDSGRLNKADYQKVIDTDLRKNRMNLLQVDS